MSHSLQGREQAYTPQQRTDEPMPQNFARRRFALCDPEGMDRGGSGLAVMLEYVGGRLRRSKTTFMVHDVLGVWCNDPEEVEPGEDDPDPCPDLEQGDEATEEVLEIDVGESKGGYFTLFDGTHTVAVPLIDGDPATIDTAALQANFDANDPNGHWLVEGTTVRRRKKGAAPDYDVANNETEGGVSVAITQQGDATHPEIVTFTLDGAYGGNFDAMTEDEITALVTVTVNPDGTIDDAALEADLNTQDPTGMWTVSGGVATRGINGAFSDFIITENRTKSNPSVEVTQQGTDAYKDLPVTGIVGYASFWSDSQKWEVEPRCGNCDE